VKGCQIGQLKGQLRFDALPRCSSPASFDDRAQKKRGLGFGSG
jgi:hypothetical protein